MQEVIHGIEIHTSSEDGSCPCRVNVHTHQLWETYGHLDIQLCLALDMPVLKKIIGLVVAKIVAGERFVPNQKYMDVVPVLPVLFEYAYEDGRVVLRMILPDQTGAFKGALKTQYEGTFSLFPMHRRILRALMADAKPVSELNRGNEQDLSFEVSQLALAGLLEVADHERVTFAPTEHGVRVLSHLHPPK